MSNRELQYCNKKLQEEKSRYDFQGQLRSAHSRCVNHNSNLRASCAGCRALAWQDILNALENQLKGETTQTASRHQVRQADTEEPKPQMNQVKKEAIRMPNIIKSER